MLEPLLNMVFYATPIIYPVDVIPEKYRWLLDLNPIAYYIKAIRQLMYEGTVPDIRHVGILVGLAGISLAQGLYVHAITKKKFIYRL